MLGFMNPTELATMVHNVLTSMELNSVVVDILFQILTSMELNRVVVDILFQISMVVIKKSMEMKNHVVVGRFIQVKIVYTEFRFQVVIHTFN